MTKAKIAELKAKLSAYVARARRGERIIVLDRDTPVAELGPIHDALGSGIDRLVADGRARSAKKTALKKNPFRGVKATIDVQQLLDEVRGDR